MGTSTSSSGPGPGVSMDPPWLDDVNTGVVLPSSDEPIQDEPKVPPHNPPKVEPLKEVAPSRRFKEARQNLKSYASTGNKTTFKKAVGHYSKKGMGGALNIVRRMKPSTHAASGLVSFLRDVKNSELQEIKDWVKDVTSKSSDVYEVIDAIIDRVTNEGGLLDEDSMKNSMANAMADLLETNSDVDLLSIGDNETWDLIENFISYEASNRIQLDIGQLFEGSALSLKEIVERREEMTDYLKEEISAQLQPFKESDLKPEINRLSVIINEAIANTFYVFEGEIE